MTFYEYIRSEDFSVKCLAVAADVPARSLEHSTTGQRPLRNARAWFIVAVAWALDTTQDYLLELDNKVKQHYISMLKPLIKA